MIKRCLVCNKEYGVYNQKRKGRGKWRKYKRGINTLNCSKRCSQIYMRLPRWKRKELNEIYNKAEKEVITNGKTE